MIYLHKILPVFLLPTGLTILLILVGLIFRKHLFCWIGLVVFWLCSMPLVSNTAMRAMEGWQTRLPVQSVPQARAIVVLSSSLKQSPGATHTSEWTSSAVNRFDAGVELFKAGKAPLLIFTGGWAPWRPDARPVGEILAERALALGISREHIFVTDKVTNTAEEARAVTRKLRDMSGTDKSRIILVTSAFHMRRSRLLFEHAGVSIIAFPVDFQVSQDQVFTILDLLPSADYLKRTEIALRESYGYLYYALAGWFF